jgi:hypothetical protein
LNEQIPWMLGWVDRLGGMAQNRPNSLLNV